MTKTMFDEFQQEWKDHQTALAIPFADVRNYQRLRERAEGELLLTNEIKHDYAVTAGQLIFLNSRDAPVTSGYVTALKRQLEAKLSQIEYLFPQLMIANGGRRTTFQHTTMQEYFVAITQECYNILTKILRQLLFSIFLNDFDLK